MWIAFAYSYRITKESDTFNYWFGLSFDVLYMCFVCEQQQSHSATLKFDSPFFSIDLHPPKITTKSESIHAIYRLNRGSLSVYQNNAKNMWSLCIWYVYKNALDHINWLVPIKKYFRIILNWHILKTHNSYFSETKIPITFAVRLRGCRGRERERRKEMVCTFQLNQISDQYQIPIKNW